VNPGFTPAFLNALMSQYLEYRKNLRRNISTETLDSIAKEVEHLERSLKTSQAALTEYQRTNNFSTLQEEASIEANYLVKLKTQLSDYQLESNLLAARELELNANSDFLLRNMPGSSSPVTTPNPRLDAQKQIAVLKAERDRVSQFLLPKHPKMMQLDLDITKAQKLVDVYGNQNHEQIVANRESLVIKMENTKKFISLWETNVAAANDLLASADGLKQ